MSLILSSLRLGLRQMIRRPGESATAVVVLALGIGLAATGWAVVWGTYLRPVPVPDSDRLVRIDVAESSTENLGTVGYEAFRYLKDELGQLESLDRLEAWTPLGFDVSGLDGPAVRANGAAVTAGLLRLTGAKPVAGRLLTEDDERAAARVVVVSEEFWRRHLNAEPIASELSFVIYGEPQTVVGVLPAGLSFPYSQEIWMLAHRDELRYGWMQVLARLSVGSEPAGARAEIEAALAHLPSTAPSQTGQTALPSQVVVEPLRDTYHHEGVRTAVLAAAGASLGILFLACANVANLLLARGLRRRREMAVRTSLGARRHQILSQLLAETSILALAGGLLGLGLCRLGMHLWSVYSAQFGTPFWVKVRLDSQVLWMIAGLVTLSCLAAGLFPAWRQARDGSLTTHAGGHETGRLSADRWLVVTQVAVSVALLATCAVFVRTVERLESGRDHLRQSNVMTARLSLHDRSTPELAKTAETWAEVLHEIASLPEVERVSVASGLPEDGAGWPGRAAVPDGRQIDASYGVAAPGLFEALGVRILAGREFDFTDQEDSGRVAVIDEDLAKAAFPGMALEQLVGRTIRFGQPGPKFSELPARTIVGVVADFGPGPPDAAPGTASSRVPQAFLPNGQTTMTSGLLVLKMRAPRIWNAAPGLNERLAAATERAAPGHPLNQLAPLSRRLEQSVTAEASARAAFSVLGLVALALAAAGLYGVLAVQVGRRRRELAVRTALGATPGDLLRRVLGSGLAMVAVGCVAGLFLGYLSTRAVRSLLHGAAPWDPVALSAAVATLMAAGLVASWIPARRAARTQPSSALKEE